MSILKTLLKKLGVAEVRVSDLQSSAKNVRTRTSRKKFRQAIEVDLEITDEFKLVIEFIKTHSPLILVTGVAGTGKSTLVRYLGETLKKNIAIIAPTGVAAMNIGGSTIHSFFKYPPRLLTNSDIRYARDRTLYEKLDLLIIDEISMVRADMMDAISMFLQKNRSCYDRSFGGVQLLLVGDLFQLPPVIATEEEQEYLNRTYPTPLFFGAKALRDLTMSVVELSKVFRQEDQEFIALLNSMRRGKNLIHALESLNSACCKSSDENDDTVVLTPTNRAASRINSNRLQEILEPESQYEGELVGNIRVDKEKLPSPYNLVVKKGARVMFTKNDPARRWVNGTTGMITKLTKDTIHVEIQKSEGSVVHEVNPVKWERVTYEYNYATNRIEAMVAGHYRQFPLMLAWAITIHKSQGKTIDKVVIDLGDGAFASGQVYVALSRCPTLSGIRFRRAISKEEVILDSQIVDFYNSIDTAR
ncbi:MAG: AAA family ATPase [candidate division Zixibacteria bacterium]|nr:AAA family ATPase [candidate division Zixibacteria bacterium]